MIDIYYENNAREKISFVKWPYMIFDGDIFDSEWDEIENDEHIQGFEKKITEKKISLTISEYGPNFKKSMDALEDVPEKDILEGVPGKLWAGNCYLKCYIKATEKDRWVNDLQHIDAELKIITDYPYWINEVEHRFLRNSGFAPGDSIWLEYPYEYPYEYAKDRNSQYLVNSNYTGSGFKMIIYGPCINPIIRVANHVYEIRTTLYEGEYAVIDSSSRNAVDRSIIKVLNDGTKEDLFNSRNKDSEIWEKIPPGRNTVTWNGNFGFDIVLFNERSSPLWNS